MISWTTLWYILAIKVEIYGYMRKFLFGWHKKVGSIENFYVFKEIKIIFEFQRLIFYTYTVRLFRKVSSVGPLQEFISESIRGLLRVGPLYGGFEIRDWYGIGPTFQNMRASNRPTPKISQKLWSYHTSSLEVPVVGPLWAFISFWQSGPTLERTRAQTDETPVRSGTHFGNTL